MDKPVKARVGSAATGGGQSKEVEARLQTIIGSAPDLAVSAVVEDGGLPGARRLVDALEIESGGTVVTTGGRLRER